MFNALLREQRTAPVSPEHQRDNVKDRHSRGRDAWRRVKIRLTATDSRVNRQMQSHERQAVVQQQTGPFLSFFRHIRLSFRIAISSFSQLFRCAVFSFQRWFARGRRPLACPLEVVFISEAYGAGALLCMRVAYARDDMLPFRASIFAEAHCQADRSTYYIHIS